MIWDTGSGIRDLGYEIWDTRSGIRDLGSGIRHLGYGIWDTESRIWDTGPSEDSYNTNTSFTHGYRAITPERGTTL